MKLPEQSKFTREELAEKWGCKLSYVKGQIRDKKLRLAFDTRDSDCVDLRDSDYYKCDDDSDVCLNWIRERAALSEIVKPVKTENIIPCPDFLYLPYERDAVWLRGPVKRKGNMEDIDEVLMNFDEVLMGTIPYDFLAINIRYFHDFDGNILIPTSFIGIDGKGEFLTLLPQIRNINATFISIAEVERFKKENTPERKGKGEKPETTKRKDNIIEIIKDLGYNPKSFPEFGNPRSPELLEIFRNNSNFENKKSKRTAKTEVWEEYALRISKKEKDDRSLSEYFDFVMGRDYKRFDKAWQALRKEGKIIYKKKPKKA